MHVFHAMPEAGHVAGLSTVNYSTVNRLYEDEKPRVHDPYSNIV